MGTSGRPPENLLDDVRAVFSDLPRPCTPVTATEIAAELDCTPHTAKQHLEQLTEWGALETKDVDSACRVWWRPAGDDEFSEFVNAVEDYAIFTLDSDGEVVSWNRGAERIKGYTEDEILGEHISVFYTDEEVEQGTPTKNLETAVERGRVEDEGWRVRKDGTVFWANVVITAIHDGDGSLRGYTKVTRDLTERKIERDKRQLHHDVGSSIATADSLEGGFENVVTAICQMTDWEYSEVWYPTDRDRELTSITHTESDAFDSFVEMTNEYEARPSEGLVGRVWQSGESVWLSDLSNTDDDVFRRGGVAADVGLQSAFCVPVIPDDEVAAVALFATTEFRQVETLFIDVIESVAVNLAGLMVRMQSEEELRREREFLDRIFEAVPMSIFVVNRDGEVERMNERARNRLCVGNSDDYPVGDRDVYDENGDPVPLEERPCMRVLETGDAVFDWEGQIDLPGGRSWMSVTAVPLDNGTPPERVITTVNDITKLKTQARRLEHRRDTLEAELRGVYERIDDAFIALDEEWRFTHVNNHAAELFGRDEADILGENIWDQFPGERDGVLWEQYHDAMETQESASFEFYFEALGAWTEVNVYPSESGLSVHIQDISDRKQYEDRLRLLSATVQAFLRAESESSVDETVVDAANRALDIKGVGVYRFDEDRDELYPAAKSLDSGFMRRNFPRIPPDESTLTGHIYSTGEPERYDDVLESPYIQLDPEETKMRSGMFVPMGSHGVLIGADSEIGAFTDEDQQLIELLGANAAAAYDRVKHERELKTRARQQEVVSELGRLALEEVDLDDLFERASQLVADALDNDYCKVLDLDAGGETLLLRQGVGWDDGTVGEARVSAVEMDSQASYTLQTAEPVVVTNLETESRFSGPDLLRSHDVKSGISTIIGTRSDPWGILGTHDTAPKQYSDEDVAFIQSVANILAKAIETQTYQRRLERIVSELEASNEKLEQFAYIASHDLQEPLRMVSNYLMLLERRYSDELDDDANDFIEFAVDGAERMREMIHGLLAYSRIDTRSNPLEPIDCESVVEGVLSDLQFKIAETNAEVAVRSLPTVTADRVQLEQVFRNLISNALKYRDDDPPRIEIGAENRDGEWVLYVEDDGIGIDPEQQDQIFEVFERLHGHAEYPGTGIGLALCQKIIHRHGGRIWVESEPEAGSTFYFSIPSEERDNA
ncbi:GAF domain-containing protein [Haloferax sp. DFSO52]|uniref:GAF domain-containing protein n=1 Tax=Haloferax sp. DFSO52 TaxID=3388505 RepID=UPI003A84714F